MMTDEQRQELEKRVAEQLGTPVRIFQGTRNLDAAFIQEMVESRQREMGEHFHERLAKVLQPFVGEFQVSYEPLDSRYISFANRLGNRRWRRHSYKSRRHIRGPQLKSVGEMTVAEYLRKMGFG